MCQVLVEVLETHHGSHTHRCIHTDAYTHTDTHTDAYIHTHAYIYIPLNLMELTMAVTS